MDNPHTHWHPPTPMLAADPGLAVAAISGLWDVWERCCGAPWGYLIGIGETGAVAAMGLWAHPAVTLAGWTAPRTWCAVGVAVHGTARPACATRVPPAGDLGRATVVWLCFRGGTQASSVGLGGRPPTITVDAVNPCTGSTPGVATPGGAVATALRRSLRCQPTSTRGPPRRNPRATPP